jgi:hypothetical protein
MQAGLQQLALAGTVEDLRKLALQTPESAEGIGGLEEIDVFLGKIERRLDQHAQVDQLLVELADGPRKFAL